MSNTLTTTQTNLISITRNSAGGSATLSFALTAKVTKTFTWPPIPEATGEWTPEVSSYEASVLELEPMNDGLKKFKTQIDINKIDGLSVERKAEKIGKNAKKAKKTKVIVNCKIHFNQEDGCAKLERYLLSGGPAMMTVTYTETPTQEELMDGPVANEDSQQAVLDGIEQDAAHESDGPAPTAAERKKARDEHEAKKKAAKKAAAE